MDALPPIPPIGSSNERGNSGIRVTTDRHGGINHVDMIVPLPEFGIAHKIQVNEAEKIFTDKLVIKKKSV